MNKRSRIHAKQLRQQMEVYHEEKTSEQESRLSLPPRSRVQKRKTRNKNKKFKLSFPLIRLLLVLFLALIIAAITSPYWLP